MLHACIILGFLAGVFPVNNGLLQKCDVTCWDPALGAHFQNEFFDKGTDFSTKCSISNPQTSTCTLDVSEIFPSSCWIPLDLGPLMGGNIPFILKLFCHNAQFIPIITNERNISCAKHIGYIQIKKCSLLWKDLDMFGELLYQYHLYLEDCEDQWDKESVDTDYWKKYHDFGDQNETGITYLQIEPVVISHGLRKLESLTIFNMDHMPGILDVFIWPSLADLTFTNTQVSSQFANIHFQINFPKLERLELTNCNLTLPHLCFPSKFDWSRGHMLMLDGNRITDLSNCTLKGLISEISLKANNLSTVNANLFFNVHGLNSIDFNTNNLKSIPAGLLRNQYELSSVSISDNLLENLPAGLFQNLTFLENVDFSANLLTEIPAGIFQSLQNLNTVDLSGNLLTGIPAGLFQSFQNLNTVDLSDNSLTEIPAGLFQSLHNLKNVDLSANLLTGIPTGLFQSLKNLYTVDLCDNLLTDIPAGLFQSLHNLNTVDLSSNFLTSIISRMFINLPTLIKINLAANQLNYIADDAISPYLDSLKYIDLSQNNFTTIPTIFQYYNVFLNENNIVCDCKLNSNYEHMHSNRNQNTTRAIPDYNKNNFTCEKPDNLHGKLLYDLKPSDLFCLENFPPCPECCTCFRRTMDEGVTVDCKQVNMFALPTQLPEGSIELDLSGNLITKLDTPYPYLAKLEKLNLQNNLIDLVSADVLDILDQGHMRKLQLNKNRLNVLPQEEDVFSSTNLSDLTLGNNPWECICHTSWMKQWLIVRRNIIQDIDKVKCATGIPAGQERTQFIEYQFNCTTPAAIVVRNELLYVGIVLCFCNHINLCVQRAN